MPSPSSNIAAIRRDYQRAALDEQTAGPDPLTFFGHWFEEAVSAAVDEANAMTLATSGKDHIPHARIVLLKGLDEKGFVFYTNYNSAKGAELDTNPRAALVFFWKELERQVRVEGIAERVSEAESERYFQSRPAGSQAGAIASPQSQVISGRVELEAGYARILEQYKDSRMPRPDHWGGYRVIPTRIEFWQGRSSRLHDRIVFERQGDTWKRFRLAP